MKQKSKGSKLSFMVRLFIFFALTFLTGSAVFAQAEYQVVSNPFIQGGVGFGTIIAVVASWSRNQSIGWAILHGILSWLYVIHFVLTRQNTQPFN